MLYPEAKYNYDVKSDYIKRFVQREASNLTPDQHHRLMRNPLPRWCPPPGTVSLQYNGDRFIYNRRTALMRMTRRRDEGPEEINLADDTSEDECQVLEFAKRPRKDPEVARRPQKDIEVVALDDSDDECQILDMPEKVKEPEAVIFARARAKLHAMTRKRQEAAGEGSSSGPSVPVPPAVVENPGSPPYVAPDADSDEYQEGCSEDESDDEKKELVKIEVTSVPNEKFLELQ